MQGENETYVIRNLDPKDLDDIVRIDSHWSGQERRDFFSLKLEKALEDTSVRVSLGAVLDGVLVGFVLASVYYGEFGRPEAVCTIDTMGVAPDYSRRGAAQAMWRQLAKNVHALGVEKVQTEVRWNDWPLLHFFERAGFRPAERICLEATLDPRSLDEIEGPGD